MQNDWLSNLIRIFALKLGERCCLIILYTLNLNWNDIVAAVQCGLEKQAHLHLFKGLATLNARKYRSSYHFGYDLQN